MSAIIRIILVVISLLTLGYVQRKIRKSQMRLEDALYWLVFSACLVIISIFPELIYKISHVLKFQSPINLVFLVIIFLLLMKLFLLSIKVSQLETKLTNLAEEVALNRKTMEDAELDKKA